MQQQAKLMTLSLYRPFARGIPKKRITLADSSEVDESIQHTRQKLLDEDDDCYILPPEAQSAEKGRSSRIGLNDLTNKEIGLIKEIKDQPISEEELQALVEERISKEDVKNKLKMRQDLEPKVALV